MWPISIDETVPAAYYKELPPNTLLITNIFTTIQGEGPYAGRPAIFVRLAGCNYGGKGVTGPGCAFCDTEFSFKNGRIITVADLILNLEDRAQEAMCGWSDPHARMLIVITGGEPMMQNNLVQFLNAMEEHDWAEIQIESNGTRLLPLPNSNVYLVWSPKIAETYDQQSGQFVNDGYAKPLRAMLERADCLKVLVSGDPKSPYYHLPSYARQFAEVGKAVYLTPINVYTRQPMQQELPPSIWRHDYLDREANAVNHAHAAALAMRYGYKVSVQSHLLLALE